MVVGDVVGHGLTAARRASYVRATIALFAEYADDPMTILRLANTALAERDPGTEFVTALCASIAPDRGTVTWASAGHPPPWDLDRGVPLAHVRHCPPLGIEPTLEGTSVTTELAPGGGVLLYTDGLPEARTAREVDRHDLFGEQAARETLIAPAGRVAGRHRRRAARGRRAPRRGPAGRRPVHGRDPPGRRRGGSAAGRVGAEARVARRCGTKPGSGTLVDGLAPAAKP